MVFGWSEQPEEANDDEVASDGVEDTPLGVVAVEFIVDAADDGEVDRVGAVCGLVFAVESPEEIQSPRRRRRLRGRSWLSRQNPSNICRRLRWRMRPTILS